MEWIASKESSSDVVVNVKPMLTTAQKNFKEGVL